ncbi:MAG: hypothetical protein NTX25_02200 [Proteobacteria bacterium]|nr:hypothetical protein [Pseudomonadota bacterium]
MKQKRLKFLTHLLPVFEAREAEALMSNYAAPKHLLMRLVANEDIIRLRRGLYTNVQSIDHFFIANRLISPSYVSFETALAHYAMIPDRVETTMSVTTHRGTSFANAVGLFQFHNQTVEIYSSSYTLEQREGYFIRIATREKALLDSISRMRVRATQMTKEEALRLAIEDLRVDESSLSSLSIRELRRLAPLYRSRAVSLLVESLR